VAGNGSTISPEIQRSGLVIRCCGCPNVLDTFAILMMIARYRPTKIR